MQAASTVSQNGYLTQLKASLSANISKLNLMTEAEFKSATGGQALISKIKETKSGIIFSRAIVRELY